MTACIKRVMCSVCLLEGWGWGMVTILKLLITNNETHTNSFRTALNLFKELLIIFCALLKKRFGSTSKNGLCNACIPTKENMYDT